VESTLTEIWLIRPWPKCGHIWPSRLWPKFGRIRQSRPWPKFSRIQSSWSRLKFCQVDLGPNLVTSSPTEIRSKVIQVHPMLKFCLVGPDKKSAKFYGVSPLDTSFKNLIWIYFMKNGFWILNLIQLFKYGFKLDLNIWIWIFKKFNLLFLKKCIWIENIIQLFGSKMDVDWIIKNPIHDHP